MKFAPGQRRTRSTDRCRSTSCRATIACHITDRAHMCAGRPTQRSGLAAASERSPAQLITAVSRLMNAACHPKVTQHTVCQMILRAFRLVGYLASPAEKPDAQRAYTAAEVTGFATPVARMSLLRTNPSHRDNRATSSIYKSGCQKFRLRLWSNDKRRVCAIELATRGSRR